MVLYQSVRPGGETGPIKWRKNGKLLNPLYLCVLANSRPWGMKTLMSEATTTAAAAAAAAASGESSDPATPNKLQLTASGRGGSGGAAGGGSGSGGGGGNDAAVESLFTANHLLSAIDLEHLCVDVTGWVEVFHRTTNGPHLAYIVTVSYGSGPSARRWTTLRSPRDLAAHTGDDYSLDKQRRQYSIMAGLKGSSSSSHSDKLKKSKSTEGLALHHQGSSDQNVRIISHRIQSSFEAEMFTVKSSSLANTSNNNNTNSTSVVSVKEAARSSWSVNEENEMGVSDGDSDQLSNEAIKACENVINVFGAQEDGAAAAPAAAASAASVTSTLSPENKAALFPFRQAFVEMLWKPHILDTWFLKGSPDQMRVPVPVKSPPRAVAIVARALWDTHWREETMMLFPSHISFFPPSSKKAVWTLALHDLISVSSLSDEETPLPRYYTLKLETIGRVHYLAFSSHESRQQMNMATLECFSELSSEWKTVPSGLLGDPRDGFLLRSGKWQPAGRLVLNARKFSFDHSATPVAAATAANSSAAVGENAKEVSSVDLSVKLLQSIFSLDSLAGESAAATGSSSSSSSSVSDKDDGGSMDPNVLKPIFASDAEGQFAGRSVMSSSVMSI